MSNDSMSQAVADVLAERQRQVSVEGWTHKHDDQHHDGSMALAAACYACNAATWAARAASVKADDYARLSSPGFRWPWAQKWWKPKTLRQDLIRAAALILAEIERLDRADVNRAAWRPCGDCGTPERCRAFGCDEAEARR